MQPNDLEDTTYYTRVSFDQASDLANEMRAQLYTLEERRDLIDAKIANVRLALNGQERNIASLKSAGIAATERVETLYDVEYLNGQQAVGMGLADIEWTQVNVFRVAGKDSWTIVHPLPMPEAPEPLFSHVPPSGHVQDVSLYGEDPGSLWNKMQSGQAYPRRGEVDIMSFERGDAGRSVAHNVAAEMVEWTDVAWWRWHDLQNPVGAPPPIPNDEELQAVARKMAAEAGTGPAPGEYWVPTPQVQSGFQVIPTPEADAIHRKLDQVMGRGKRNKPQVDDGPLAAAVDALHDADPAPDTQAG